MHGMAVRIREVESERGLPVSPRRDQAPFGSRPSPDCREDLSHLPVSMPFVRHRWHGEPDILSQQSDYTVHVPLSIFRIRGLAYRSRKLTASAESEPPRGFTPRPARRAGTVT